jgi:hypothetical protein
MCVVNKGNKMKKEHAMVNTSLVINCLLDTRY